MKSLLIAVLIFLSLLTWSSCDTSESPTAPKLIRDTVLVKPGDTSGRAVITFLQRGVIIQYGDQVFLADTIKEYASDRVMVEWTCPCDFESTSFIGTGPCEDSTKLCSQIEYK